MSEFSDLQCGLTNDHIVREPISLECGHTICKKRVNDQVKVECKICNEETDKSELRLDSESVPIKRMKLSSLSESFDRINSFKS